MSRCNFADQLKNLFTRSVGCWSRPSRISDKPNEPLTEAWSICRSLSSQRSIFGCLFSKTVRIIQKFTQARLKVEGQEGIRKRRTPLLMWGVLFSLHLVVPQWCIPLFWDDRSYLDRSVVSPSVAGLERKYQSHGHNRSVDLIRPIIAQTCWIPPLVSTLIASSESIWYEWAGCACLVYCWAYLGVTGHRLMPIRKIAVPVHPVLSLH